MIDRANLDTYIEVVTKKLSSDDAHTTLSRFMCRCLSLVEQFLPDAGRKILAQAKMFWLEGQGQPEDLVLARNQCWSYLDTKGRGVRIEDQEDAAMRALICVLYPEPDNDDFSTDTMRWFADMFDRLDYRHADEVNQLMEKSMESD